MRRIDFFMNPKSYYDVLQHFTESLFEAVKRQGVNCRLLLADKTGPDSIIQALKDDPPDCTLCINGLMPDINGELFCDKIGIPHVAYLVDSPLTHLSLTTSPFSIITCMDYASVEFLKNLGFKKTFFMPHAIDATLNADPSAKRKFDIVMLSSCIDYEEILESWKVKYPPYLCQAMMETASLAMKNTLTPLHVTFVQVLDQMMKKQEGIDPKKIDFVLVINDIESYIRGIDKVELVRSIHDAKVHVFGSATGTKGWKYYLKDQKNITFHEPVPYEMALEIMKQSKIVLNSIPSIINGAHERIFAALALGACVLTSENIYLRNQFENGKSILFYQIGKWDVINDLVNEMLADEAKRQEIAVNGRQIVMCSHTWDVRAKELLQELDRLLT